MMDDKFLERALRLDDAERRELLVALQDSLDDGKIDPTLAKTIDERLADADKNPENFVTLDAFERTVRATQHA